MSLLIAWAVSVPGVFLAGFAFGYRYRLRTTKHQHNWSPWKQVQVGIVSTATGKALYERSAQQRRCLDCGYHDQAWIDLGAS